MSTKLKKDIYKFIRRNFNPILLLLFYPEKDSLLLIYLEKEFDKFIPKDSNFIKKEFLDFM